MRRIILATACAAALLVACGGGGGDAMPAPADGVPESASRSLAGMMAYLAGLTATTPEDGEALDVSGFAPPQPDEAEPEALP